MKKASHWDAFFAFGLGRLIDRPGCFSPSGKRWVACALLGLWCVAGASGVLADECPSPRIDERAAVSRVIDGDTLRLADGRKVRLIGINTPELARDGRPAEPLAQAARTALVKMLKGVPNVGLQFGRERFDRYKRLLAHVYLPDGQSVERRLLEAGLAAHIVVLPNIARLRCYQQAERRARRTGGGVWRSVYRPVPVAEVMRDRGGFRIITGNVVRVGESKRSLWLNFQRRPGEGLREGVAVRISREDLGYFTRWDPRQLKGRRVTVRGWWRPYKKQLVTRLRHPAALEILQ
ncbi:MAG: thermonuclease family protein [Gammaproteobacteria bacterium]|nr:thermonuclease family protein [Gammaproteobacteria bacterium]